MPPQSVKATATSPRGVQHATIPATEAQLRAIRSELKKLEGDEAKYCASRGIAKLEDLSALAANEAIVKLGGQVKPEVK